MNGFNLMEQLGIAALGLGITAFFIAYSRFMYRPKGSKEYLTGHATVVSRRVDQKGRNISGTFRGNPNMTGFSRWMYLVTFDLGAQLLELQVSEADYGRLKEGLTGELEWQYEYLMSFVPDTAE